jgi:hypothetical protein
MSTTTHRGAGRRSWSVGVAALAAVSLTGLASCTTAAPVRRTPAVPAQFELPPAGVPWDYQIGRADPPLDPVRVVSRDRLMAPVPSTPGKPMYNFCYVNGFQGQPNDPDQLGPPPEGSDAWWEAQHLDLVRQRNGEVIKDTEWKEDILDITTADKRARVADIVGMWIDGCADAGFQGVEIDNLDSYERTGGSEEEQAKEQPYAVAYMRLLADRAHSRGLAVGQKNSSVLVPLRTQMGTDFAVVEECYEFGECDSYTGDAGYGDLVYIVEYKQASFARGCSQNPQSSLVLRDKQVARPTTLSDLCLRS